MEGTSAGRAATHARDCHPLRCRQLVCVGDIHGNLAELRALWEALETELGREALDAAAIVFLGDYCDRGPDTALVLDWLVSLQKERREGSHLGPATFLAGNHDFGMAAFLGCLPEVAAEFDLDSTRPAKYTKGFFPHPVPGGMHYQGRRWGGSDIFEAESTFRSYGVEWPEDSCTVPAHRTALNAAVPEEHKEFLRNLRWVHEFELAEAGGDVQRVLCVHAGLRADKDLDAQLCALRHRDITDPICWAGPCGERLTPLCGRGDVLDGHPALAPKAITYLYTGWQDVIVSGHHGCERLSTGRIIIDKSGGNPTCDSPLQAMVLPQRTIVEVWAWGLPSLGADNGEEARGERKVRVRRTWL